MTILDFVSIMGAHPWTALLLSKHQFLNKLFEYLRENEDHSSVLTNNLMVLAAFTSNLNKSIFNAFSDPNYQYFFKKYLESK